MKTLASKFQLMAKTFLCALLAVASVNAFAQLNVQDIGAFVSADQAQEWMSNFEFENQDAIFGHLYGKQTLNEILAQEGAQGIKIFNGLDEAGTAKLVFYAANGNGEPEGMAYDISSPCPPFCTSDIQQDIENIGARIDTNLANQWVQNFETTYPLGVSSFLYGKRIFKQLLNVPQIKGLYFANSFDGQGLQQLLMVGVDDQGIQLMNYPIAAHAKSQTGTMLSASK